MENKMKTHDEQTFFYDMFEEMWPKDKADVIDLNAELTHLEVSRIQEALLDSKGNQSHAAKMLNIGRVTLIQKMKKYNIK
jgi:transcriptional regulator with PAS, ATPase and Fis domain